MPKFILMIALPFQVSLLFSRSNDVVGILTQPLLGIGPEGLRKEPILPPLKKRMRGQ